MSCSSSAQIQAPAPKLLSALVLAVCLACLTASCTVRRELRLNSKPEGAVVRIDDKIVGETPLVVPFEHYGTRRFTFTLPGYFVETRVKEISPPWYLRYGLDFVSELLFPWAWQDIQRVRVRMRPESSAIEPWDIEGLLRRSESLRRAGPQGPARRGSKSRER